MKSVVFWPIRRYAADCVGTIPETMISWRCAAAIRSRRRRSSGVVSELRLSGRIGTGTPARTPRGARAGDRPSTRRSYRPAARSCRPPPPPASAAPPHPAPAAAAAAARRGATVLLPVLRYTYSPRPGPAMNLRTARAERGAVQPKGYVSFSEGRKGLERAVAGQLARAKARQVPAAGFLDFLDAGARAAVPPQGSGIRNREPHRGGARHPLLRVVLLRDTVRCHSRFAFSAASISTRRSSCVVLPHEFLKTRFVL